MPSKREPTYLITTSILDSFNWLNNCPPSWRDRAYASIVSSLRREPWTPHKSAERGIQFEEMVFQEARSLVPKGGSPHFLAVVDRCKGGTFQRVIKQNIDINGLDVLLYGKVDVLFNDKIIDIKTTENYRGEDKYLNGWQHQLYLAMTGLKDFAYLVVLFEPMPSNTIIDVYETGFHTPNPNSLIEDIKEGITDFHEWLEDEGLWSDYDQTFSNNSRR